MCTGKRVSIAKYGKREHIREEDRAKGRGERGRREREKRKSGKGDGERGRMEETT